MTKSQFLKEVIPLGDKIHRLAFRFLKDAENVKDVVQSIYLKLWEKRGELDQIKSIEGYAIRMTKNTCLDRIKLQKDNVDLSDYNQPTKSEEENIESVQIVKNIINTLPNLQRQVIELRDIDGFSFDEIAEALELPVNNIRVSLSIARKKVREEFIKINNYGL